MLTSAIFNTMKDFEWFVSPELSLSLHERS